MLRASQSVVSRRRIELGGVVQGVGFRPFVYNLARQQELSGYVLNSSSGVTIEIEGSEAALDAFIHTLKDQPLSLARIETFQITDVEPLGEDQFVILKSAQRAGEFVLIPPDIATCAQCLSETLDPQDRRYGYPFTNCTDCGPRYTIIQDIPYDRAMTTMVGFQMCPSCKAEYQNPSNRRFHAQPNACPVCGPAIVLAKKDSFLPCNACYGQTSLSLSILRDIRDVLQRGEILAIKGLGGFHLVCDATNEAAVHALRMRKKRSDKPFALMARDIIMVEQFCELSGSDRKLLLSPEHPIVIVRRRPGSAIVRAVAPGNDTLGVMLPYTPLQWLLFGEALDSPPVFTALVMTSGNISEEPIVTSNEEAWKRLHSVADGYVFHNRGIHTRVDDSVARNFEGAARVLRRSRGYAPCPVDLKKTAIELVACGAGQKNTLCLTKGRYAILSQHIGDADNFETLEFFEETLERMKKLFRVEPRAVAYDLHPLYLTSKFAYELRLERIGVQHHHAHIASCMAENHISNKVIGVALDGTGYGPDGNVWGGEFLVADFTGFERRAHFRYIPLPGGDAAVRQPWRAALTYLRETFGNAIPEGLPLRMSIPEKQLAIVQTMLEQNLGTVLTSSCGRLFDAVAALIGIRHEVTFEGQAAIELENLCQTGIEEQYPFSVANGDCLEIDFRPAIAAITDDVLQCKSSPVIASLFHNTIAAAVVEACRCIRQEENISRVCLSGGTFQNWYLLQQTVPALRTAGFEVYLHSLVPPNDGGISLGQAVIANEILQHGAKTCV